MSIMKNNEKVSSYMTLFQSFKIKSPHPAYEVLKPYLPYLESVWEQIRPIKGSRRPFLGFSDLRYHYNIEGA